MLYNLPIAWYNLAMGCIKYISIEETAKKWCISERSVRNYCSLGRVPGAVLDGKTWKIPSTSKKPERAVRHAVKKELLLEVLKREKDSALRGGIYHKIQIDLTYNSNHIEGSKLSHDQTRFIFETKTLGITKDSVKIDDIIETANHFRCIDLIIESAKSRLTESLIKQLHFILKSGTSDCQKIWFKVGGYKMLENEVGGQNTAKPAEVAGRIKTLLLDYNSKKEINLDDILDFHVQFESIHPFQDGNGRVGRLIMFKECLKHNIVPFIITDGLKLFYYRGLREWKNERGFLRDTCLTAQDFMKETLGNLGIEY